MEKYNPIVHLLQKKHCIWIRFFSFFILALITWFCIRVHVVCKYNQCVYCNRCCVIINTETIESVMFGIE